MGNISAISPDKCCGCKACGDSCPVGAISFENDVEGFQQPVINANCISCGKCLSVCPVENVRLNAKPEYCRAAYSTKEINRINGSSGGIFSCMAEIAFSKRYVVYGAELNSKLKCHHTMAHNSQELIPLLKSKYIQSDTQGIYSEIRNILKEGGKVLFCGTPCQCSALKNIVRDLPNNLLLVDFVCHGVPSQELFDKCIKWYEKQKHLRVKGFQFRYKGKNVKHPQSYMITCVTEKGRQIIKSGLHYQFPYYFAFQTHISLRRSCYNCKYARPERCSDITLGDFWGIDKLNLEFRANEGISMVSSNTEKGEAWLEKLISLRMIECRDVRYDFAIENNECLKTPTMKPGSRDAFFDDLKTKDFSAVVNRYMKSKKQFVFDLYYAMPTVLRRIVRRIMDKHVKYE